MDVRVEGRPPVQGPDRRKREIYSHSLDCTLSVRDVRAEVARESRRRPKEKAATRAFLQSKRRLLLGYPFLTEEAKAKELARFDERFDALLKSPE